MNVNAQKRLAAEILKCGENRVYIEPDFIDDVSMAITREDIRNLIKNKIISKRNKIGISRIRANLNLKKKQKGRARGIGSRKGKKTARSPPKRNWINRIRPLRRELKKLRNTKQIEISVYRKLYLKAKGGAFNSVATLYRYIEENKLMRN
ncbi:50S ribosomal protein L19e [Promethearchaeum syntrophicum]|uniref:Large ribosomal subunit protein eL19 n=1 Tax=Promethearchaeum syntrophicum TaxID=2594042 RepID=A0A5B9D7Y5_9ARCH|nr:50S ribosomal protein L19e [Candidatus Prometheoarchaeum syntrophicum]QEE15348.1 50S ribosomal protein L19e [Candidatus Prometheoarchaeum syntrophicum]